MLLAKLLESVMRLHETYNKYVLYPTECKISTNKEVNWRILMISFNVSPSLLTSDDIVDSYFLSCDCVEILEGDGESTKVTFLIPTDITVEKYVEIMDIIQIMHYYINGNLIRMERETNSCNKTEK